jgi:hypothetical protein
LFLEHSKIEGVREFPHIPTNTSEPKMKEPGTGLDSAIEAISKLYRRYSPQDIATSLFVSSVWLPNIASPFKHLLLTGVFASLKPIELSTSDSIKSYNDFSSLLKELYVLLPSFHTIEDYIPEPDWGDVKFHHEGYNYRIFYGDGLENIFDNLTLFQMLYGSFEEEYLKFTNRSPTKELLYCLLLQDDFISRIRLQPSVKNMPKLTPGHLEIPPPEFWNNVSNFYNNYVPNQIITESFLKNFSIPLGSIPRSSLNRGVFGNMFSSKELLSVFFIEKETRYFPILPRRYSSILFNVWGKLFENYREKILNDGTLYSMRVGGELNLYIKERLRTSSIFPFVSAITKQGSPHEILFSTAFISKNKLVLVYITQPVIPGQMTSKELEVVAPKLKEALELISTSHITLALHFDRKNIQCKSNSYGEILEPMLIVVIPQVSTQYHSFSIPESLLGHIMSLDEFLGIVDELEDVDSLALFVEYFNEIREKDKSPFLNTLDKFCSFKLFHGVLFSGAEDPEFVMLDPHMGSNMRFKTLANFWKLYPKTNFYGHPRSWKITQKTETSLRLEARGYFGCSLFCQVGSTHIFITAPFHKMSIEEAEEVKIANLLMECLEDSITRRKDIFEKHQFFNKYDQLQVIITPYSLVSRDNVFTHLRHLQPKDKRWCSDYVFLKKTNIPSIRMVFNYESLIQEFMNTKDSSLEVDLLLEILTQLNRVLPDTNIDSIRNNLLKTKSDHPRFKIFMREQAVSFPEFTKTCEPNLVHYKKATKRIAELAKQKNLSAGHYSFEEAKVKIDVLRDLIVTEMNSEVSKYNFKKAIPYLLSLIDALTNKYDQERSTMEHAVEHDIDYEIEVIFSQEQSEYVRMHRNYRYLIEKFVQLQPSEQRILKEGKVQYLIALANWLIIFYQASDSFHYGINPVGMTINDNYLIEIEFEGGLDLKQKIFGEEMSKLELGLIGNLDDRVDSPMPVEDFLNELDRAFNQDMGFSLRNMVEVLKILSYWAEWREDVEENVCYSARADAIEETCLENIKKINRNEIKPILQFLTLRSYDVIRILGQKEPQKDIPIWEHRKRYARYTLRPLILIDDEYHWGPYSTQSAGIIWLYSTSSGTLPTDLQGPTIQSVIDAGKKLIENALVNKTLEITMRYTPHVKTNVELHRLFKQGGHPEDLGDYDVLAYHPEKKVVLNIECKDILSVHCLKDLKRLREKIFGRAGKDQGYIKQINRRQDYLSDHFIEIATALQWPNNINKIPKIIPIYLSRSNYWWTRFPPTKTDIVFLRVELLSKFIEEL